jgi:hypothetical protein
MPTQNQQTEYLWPWLDRVPLPKSFFGQIIIEVEAGCVTEYEVRVTHRRQRQRGGKEPPAGLSEKLRPDT